MSDPTRWAAVLFDLDGTLIDSIELALRCYRHTIRTHLGAEPDDGAWIRDMGRPLREQLARFARTADEVEAMVETYVGLQAQIHDDLVRPYPGVPETLAALERLGIPVAIVTSKRERMTRRGLEHCGIARHFDVVVTPEDVRRAKPDPEPVRLALRRLGDPPASRVLFVGDSPHDVAAGRAAGVRTAGALWGPFPCAALMESGADYLLESMLDLLELRGD